MNDHIVPDWSSVNEAYNPAMRRDPIPKMDMDITESKQLPVKLDAVLQDLHKACRNRRSRERSLAVTKLQESIMWLGMDLKNIGTPDPYPNSYKPENTIVDPTADGLKL